MTDTQEIIKELVNFRDQRNWSQFHNVKDLSLALSIEAGELNELFLWKNKKQVSEIPEERVREELADVFAYAFLIAEKYNFDVKEIILEKIRKNDKKYPVEHSRNSAKKYNELK